MRWGQLVLGSLPELRAQPIIMMEPMIEAVSQQHGSKADSGWLIEVPQWASHRAHPEPRHAAYVA